jgi:hypothetical protein
MSESQSNPEQRFRAQDGFLAYWLDGRFRMSQILGGTVYPLQPGPEDHLRIAPGFYSPDGRLLESFPR